MRTIESDSFSAYNKIPNSVAPFRIMASTPGTADLASKPDSSNFRKSTQASGSTATSRKASAASRTISSFFNFPNPSIRLFGGVRRSETAHQVRPSKDDFQNNVDIAMYELSDVDLAYHDSVSESSKSRSSQDSFSMSSSGSSEDSAYDADIESLPTGSYPEAFLIRDGAFVHTPEFCYNTSKPTPIDIDSGYFADDDYQTPSSKSLKLGLPTIKVFNEYGVDITNDPPTGVWIKARPAMTISQFRISGNTPACHYPHEELEAASVQLRSRVRTAREKSARFRRYMGTDKYY